MLFFSQASPAPPVGGTAPLAERWLRPLVRHPALPTRNLGGGGCLNVLMFFSQQRTQPGGLKRWGGGQCLPEQTRPQHREPPPAASSPGVPGEAPGEGGGGVPTSGRCGVSRCVGASAVKYGLISGLFALFLGITLTKGEMTSCDDSGVN